MPGLMAARAANRMGARQQYRTMSRMQRRRSYIQDRMGVRQDFEAAGGEEEAAPARAAPEEPDYMAELEELSQLKEKGIISDADFEAKKKQLLGI